MDRNLLAFYLSRDGDLKSSGRFIDCGAPGLGFVGVCVHDPTHAEVYHPFSCMLRICPTCAARRSAQLAEALEKPIAALVRASPRRYTLKHLILTTSLSLFGETDHVRLAMRDYRIGVRVILQNLFPGDKLVGGLIGAEFGERGRKLHFHVLLLSPYVNQDELQEAWFKLTDGRGRWTFVRKIDAVSEGISEVCKYITKPAAASDDEKIEEIMSKLHFVMKGIRRFQPFGSMFKMPRNVEECDTVCPDCGSVLMWQPELEWSKNNLERFSNGWNDSLYLKEANKSPPANYKQLGLHASFDDCYPPTPLWYN